MASKLLSNDIVSGTPEELWFYRKKKYIYIFATENELPFPVYFIYVLFVIRKVFVVGGLPLFYRFDKDIKKQFSSASRSK